MQDCKSRLDRANRSSLLTTMVSPVTSARISSLNSGRSFADLPDAFSLKTRSQPAAFRASTWAE
jgi:hypothetical protein